ncbi:MAG: hypothetical protein EPN84_05965 [Legionella sp.]|nr:MAG: hypothetical protein EPN84_05965 [Legionella sp.]
MALKQNSPNSDVDFMDACKTALEEAKPTLEEDIGWGEYLENLWNRLIDFCKSVMGMKTGFFENKSEYSKSISDKVDRLKASKL